MKVKKAVIGIVLTILSGGVVLTGYFLVYLLVFSSIFTSSDIPHKSDEELISNFQSHRGEFNQLLQMVMSDKGLYRVDNDWSNPNDPQTIGIDQGRIDEYRRWFRRLGIPRGFSANQDLGTVEFISSSQGLAVSGSSKSYVYTKQPPPNLVDSIDKYVLERKGGYPVYRHIEGDWYLEFEAD